MNELSVGTSQLEIIRSHFSLILSRLLSGLQSLTLDCGPFFDFGVDALAGT